MSNDLENEKEEILIEEQPVTTTEIESPDTDTVTIPRSPQNRAAWLITLALIALVAILGLWWISAQKNKPANIDADDVQPTSKPKSESADTGGDKSAEREVKLTPEQAEAAKIQIEGVTQRPAVSLLNVTGTVEANPQQTQGITPLVAGRVEQVFVSIGDRIAAGQPVASLMSSEIADAYGKWREAETRFALAQKNMERVKRAENRVAILQSKARLDEADATLKRTKRLIELGAGAGKDLISAETNYKSAQADYDFQRNIPLNKEIQEAQAEVETSRITALQEKQSLQALGVSVNSTNADVRNVALVSVRAPLSGVVTERMVSPGAGIQAGQQMFTVSNLSTVWITANVPEQQLGSVHIGSIAEVRTTSAKGVITARVSYIDPQISADTRTARVRIAVDNPGERLRAGMFTEVGFQTGTNAGNGEELVVPSVAVQTIEGKSVVFVPQENEPNTYAIREIETGGETGGYTRVLSGLELGEKVVTRGSFALKTQLLKGSIGDDDQ
jgi:cobalt-zinc-cadmium efflux system membrane fusion protein